MRGRRAGRERRTPVELPGTAAAAPAGVPGGTPAPRRRAGARRATRPPAAAPGGRWPAPGAARVLSAAAAAALIAATSLVGVLVSVPVREVPVRQALVPAQSSAAGAAPASLPPGVQESGDSRAAALTELLAARAGALLARDREGWMAPVAEGPAAAGWAEHQGRVFDHLAEVPLAAWRWEYAGEGAPLDAVRLAELGSPAPVEGSPAPPQPWVAHVVLVYQLRDGGGEVRREQHLTVVPDGAPADGATTATGGSGDPGAGPRWRLAADTDGPTAVDLWDLGPVRVARGERSVVVGTGDVEAYVDVTDEAARRVDAVWGQDWPRTSLVEVPATQAQLARLLGREDEVGLEQIAAVTTGETAGGQLATTGDRVVVNPEGFAALGELGRRVVMTHELTPVATRATTKAPVPIWLGEGYADWVGYQGSGLSRRTVAHPLLEAVRRGGGPTALATTDDFDPTLGDVAGAYAGSWLAVDVLAREHGGQAVTDFYRAVASEGPVEVDLARARPGEPVEVEGAARLDAALRAHFGVDEAGLVLAWQAHLAELAGTGDAARAPAPGSPA